MGDKSDLCTSLRTETKGEVSIPPTAWVTSGRCPVRWPTQSLAVGQTPEEGLPYVPRTPARPGGKLLRNGDPLERSDLKTEQAAFGGESGGSRAGSGKGT